VSAAHLFLCERAERERERERDKGGQRSRIWRGVLMCPVFRDIKESESAAFVVCKLFCR
jgi:hypothetical protein